MINWTFSVTAKGWSFPTVVQKAWSLVSRLYKQTV